MSKQIILISLWIYFEFLFRHFFCFATNFWMKWKAQTFIGIPFQLLWMEFFHVVDKLAIFFSSEIIWILNHIGSQREYSTVHSTTIRKRKKKPMQSLWLEQNYWNYRFRSTTKEKVTKNFIWQVFFFLFFSFVLVQHCLNDCLARHQSSFSRSFSGIDSSRQ